MLMVSIRKTNMFGKISPWLAACLFALGSAACSSNTMRAGNTPSAHAIGNGAASTSAANAMPPAPAAAASSASSFAHAPADTREALEKAAPVTAKHAMVVSDQHLATE